jgi:hypothetical protein
VASVGVKHHVTIRRNLYILDVSFPLQDKHGDEPNGKFHGMHNFLPSDTVNYASHPMTCRLAGTTVHKLACEILPLLF